MSSKATISLLENLQMKVTVGHHAWLADEPGNIGGDDIGPSPFDMLFGSLGACTVVMLTQYASKAKIPVTGVWCDVSGKWLGKPYHVADGYELERHIRVRGDLGEKDLQRLEKAADRCPVHQLLEKAATVKTTIEQV